jgi:hypothetical protein
MDRWMEAASVEGPWSKAKKPPATLETVLKSFDNDPQVDLLDHLAADIKDAFENGTVPALYVSTTPAELIETEGEPQFAPIDGTKLLWVKNSTTPVLLTSADQETYVLLSGRWFRAKSLKGPWEFVPANKLPADFAKIPETHPRGDVLVSVAGTPQAQEAVIANGVPQTTTIKRDQAKLQVVYDGEPRFEPIEGTKLKYAVNSPTPVIQIDANTYYAVENGVWFTASLPTGPWTVAKSVPPEIYSVPDNSPIYYVTYSYVYDSTPDDVSVGYSPGYLGAYESPEGVVVYGTGWDFAPWIGRHWFGRPWTYGWGARFGWTAGGWGFGFATGVGRPWWGPVGWHSGWGGTTWRQGWHGGWGGRYTNAHINHINFGNFNLYNRWGDGVLRHASATNANRAVSGTKSLNNVLAGHDGNVFRRAGNGWETHSGQSWQRHEPIALQSERTEDALNRVRQLQRDWEARHVGEARVNHFNSASGNFGATPFAPVRPIQPASIYRSVPMAPYHPIQPLGGYGGFHGGYNGFRGAPTSFGGAFHGGGGFHAGGHR